MFVGDCLATLLQVVTCTHQSLPGQFLIYFCVYVRSFALPHAFLCFNYLFMLNFFMIFLMEKNKIMMAECDGADLLRAHKNKQKMQIIIININFTKYLFVSTVYKLFGVGVVSIFIHAIMKPSCVA